MAAPFRGGGGVLDPSVGCPARRRKVATRARAHALAACVRGLSPRRAAASRLSQMRNVFRAETQTGTTGAGPLRNAPMTVWSSLSVPCTIAGGVSAIQRLSETSA